MYQFKLLAVDVPAASSAEQRLYVEGDAKLYHRGGVINELRDPFLQVRSPQALSSSTRSAQHVGRSQLAQPRLIKLIAPGILQRTSCACSSM